MERLQIWVAGLLSLLVMSLIFTVIVSERLFYGLLAMIPVSIILLLFRENIPEPPIQVYRPEFKLENYLLVEFLLAALVLLAYAFYSLLGG